MKDTYDIYFVNGHHARLKLGDFHIWGQQDVDWGDTPYECAKRTGATVINWVNVCMIRLAPEQTDDDD